MSNDGQQTAGELFFDDAVVSAATLARRLDGVQRVIVRPNAVITPAARDILRERKIELAYQTNATNNGDSRTPLAIAVANTRFNMGELMRALRNEPIAIRSVVPWGFAEMLEQITGDVVGGTTLGLFVSDDAAAALCLANRVSGVRAASAANAVEAADVVRSIGANLLVVRPGGRSLFEMKSVVTRFCRGWPRECPEVWKGKM
ncbi:MAG TPA: hypothetical protein VKB78_00810 [Pirellulales bacterium]|nr:hypothetical protein [Pirellulales bacterium]